MDIEQLEAKRQALQADLDKQKCAKDRNAMGQFATPIGLATDVLTHAKNLLPPGKNVRFLDPAFGTGSFYSALKKVFPKTQIEVAAGFEIDEHYGRPALDLWKNTGLECLIADFTLQRPPVEEKKFNLIVCNPPYIRHHHLKDKKERLNAKARDVANMNISGLAGLYCYFLAIAHGWMKQNGIAGWLIPSEFMDVNYGQSVKNYLLNEVTLIQVHRFDPSDIQFEDALVSSAVIWFQNKKPAKDHKVKFTYGNAIDRPAHEKDVSISSLASEKKWTRFPLAKERVRRSVGTVGDFFDVKRGIATGDNRFFVLTREMIEDRGLPLDQFRPVLPTPRYLDETVINADACGFPDIKNRLFVLDSKIPIEEMGRIYPALHKYIEEGIRQGVSEKYLCAKRKFWYSQENRPPSPFYCTYIGRTGKEGGRPFRFILNRSSAIVTNSYLILYPKPLLKKLIEKRPELSGRIFDALSQITGQAMIDEARVYGGGMRKIEPKELLNVEAPELSSLISGLQQVSN